MSDTQINKNTAAYTRHRAIAAGIRPLPNLYFRSLATLTVLYGTLTFLLIVAAEAGFLSAAQALLSGLIIAAVQFVVSPWILDLSLRFLYRVEWVSKDALPAHLTAFVERVCAEESMRFPSFGIIPDGAPTAFTYGHHPGNARVVLSRGMFELLAPEEVDGVVAHEIGHACHWDMVVMTIAQLAPLIAYYIYRTATEIAQERDKQRGVASLVAIGAYAIYAISQLAVLWFSRTREYYADQFAGEKTKDPNALARALVKIGYGLAARGGAPSSRESRASRFSSSAGASFGALNIFDKGSALQLVVTTKTDASDGGFDQSVLKGALQWDLWNPWATFFELQSTHPLVAKRLERLGDQAVFLQQEPLVIFDREKPESYWDEFLVDVIVTMLPTIGLICGLLLLAGLVTAGAFNPRLFGLVAIMTGAGLLLKTRMAYRGEDFPAKTVAELLQEIKVSPVRPVPATISGTIIGKGVPGLIWSEDFIVRDETGIIFLDYRQPLKIWEWFFGLLKAGSFQGQQVRVHGWFRRAPLPYVEIGSITTEADGVTRSCWVKTAKNITGVIIVAAGVLILLS